MVFFWMVSDGFWNGLWFFLMVCDVFGMVCDAWLSARISHSTGWSWGRSSDPIPPGRGRFHGLQLGLSSGNTELVAQTCSWAPSRSLMDLGSQIKYFLLSLILPWAPRQTQRPQQHTQGWGLERVKIPDCLGILMILQDESELWQVLSSSVQVH